MKNSDINNIYNLDGKVPVSKAIPFGLQHIFGYVRLRISHRLLLFQVLAV